MTRLFRKLYRFLPGLGGSALSPRRSSSELADSEVQSVLLAIFRAANAAESIAELFGSIHHELAKLLDTSNLYVALYDESSGLYSFPYHVDQYESVEQQPLTLAGSLTDYVRRTGTPLLADERVHESLTQAGEVELVGVPSPIWLGVPLKIDHKTLGVLAVQSYDTGSLYGPRDLDLLSFVAGNIALVVERKRSEVELRQSEKRFRDLFEASPDGVFVEDLEGNVLDVNPAAVALQGIERERLIGMNVAQLVPAENRDEAMANFRRLASGEIDRIEGFTLTGDGRSIPVEVHVRSMEYSGEPALLIQVRDMTERKEHEARLEYLARFDALTGLANRFLFEDRMRQALLSAQRSDSRVALLYLDLDDFKDINDTLGHLVGDELLKATAERLEREIRASDSVARLGGDEFAIIQPQVEGPAAPGAFALRLLETVARPFQVAGHAIHISTSIGITISSGQDDPGDLMLQADRALYKAKGRGRGNYEFHDENLAREVERYVALRADLRGALERRELFLEYQPQVDLDSGRIVGCEALVRWRHPTRGLLYPGEFIPVIDNTSLIVELGDWVLAEACRQRARWRDQGLAAAVVAVNLSAVQFRDPKFASKLATVLDRSGLPAELLELELTETVLMHGSDEIRRALVLSKEQGVSIAIDDFGTGYSSLRYLRAFPVQRLKIAMEFVQGVTDDVDAAAIVEAVISLGHKLGIRLVAEGVETEQQRDFLLAHGCDQAQGFHFGRPVEAGELAELLRARGRLGGT